MKFVIVRHGERIDKVDLSWLSTAEHPTDPYLSNVGFEQARAVGEHLKRTQNITRIYVSPFTRTLQTATEITKALHLPLFVEPGICEWLNPDWHDRAPFYWPPLAESKMNFPRIKLDYAHLVDPAPFEDVNAVRARVGEFATSLLANLKAAGGNGLDDDATVLFVTHGKIVEELAVALARVKELPYVTYCSVTDVVPSGDVSFRLGDYVCDVAFLPEAIRPRDPSKLEDASYA
jgi:broad specificity phosphatase PhoE